MPNFSGLWTIAQQMRARGASTWPAPPGAPTIGTATAGGSLCASVTFTAPACAGFPATITGYRVISTPGCFSNTGASSPVVVSGLSSSTSYTFKAQATNANGYGALSAASNSITAVVQGQQAFTTIGTYTWVAPAGVCSVSVVAVGGGGGGGGGGSGAYGAGSGGGGALVYGNNISVTPSNSYTIFVGSTGQNSYFSSTCVLRANGGTSGLCGQNGGAGGAGGTSSGSAKTGGGNGGAGGGYPGGYTTTKRTAGGGAGGYTGNGGNGLSYDGGSTSYPPTAGSGGGGGGGTCGYCCYPGTRLVGQGGGGVGILGASSSGAAGTGTGASSPGGGGSGGCIGSKGAPFSGGSGGPGGVYGGGGGGSGFYPSCGVAGGKGAVRIIWPGTTRSFPSTNTGNL